MGGTWGKSTIQNGQHTHSKRYMSSESLSAHHFKFARHKVAGEVAFLFASLARCRQVWKIWQISCQNFLLARRINLFSSSQRADVQGIVPPFLLAPRTFLTIRVDDTIPGGLFLIDRPLPHLEFFLSLKIRGHMACGDCSLSR